MRLEEMKNILLSKICLLILTQVFFCSTCCFPGDYVINNNQPSPRVDTAFLAPCLRLNESALQAFFAGPLGRERILSPEGKQFMKFANTVPAEIIWEFLERKLP